MEIRKVVRGTDTSFATRPARKAERESVGTVRPSADRVELSRQWAEALEGQRAQTQAALLSGGKGKDKDEGGILGYMETEEDKLDALSEEMDVQMKCLKIAMNIMKGKKVPPEDERYLMEHDPEGYKLALAMRGMEKEDDEECESVLEDEDKKSGGSSGTGEAAPAEGGGAAPSDGGEAASSEDGGAE